MANVVNSGSQIFNVLLFFTAVENNVYLCKTCLE